jgi:bacteriorhodopsin
MLCGFFGFHTKGVYKWIALAIGVIFGYQIFATILILFTHKHSELHRVKSPLTYYYLSLSTIWLVGWSLYVFLWVLGVEGLHVVPNNAQFWCMALLDFFCKDVTEIVIATIRFKEDMLGIQKDKRNRRRKSD